MNMPDISFASFIKNVRVNNISGASEPKIICNPKDKNILALSANDFSVNNNLSRIFISEDKGNTWQPKEIPLSHKFKQSTYSDPWIDYDNDGNLYFAAVQQDLINSFSEAVYFCKSTDNGNTWNTGHDFIDQNSKQNVFLDKPKIHINKSYSALNIVYVTWIQIKGLNTHVMFSKSTDGGDNFSVPVSIEDQDVNHSSVISDLNGNLFLAFVKDENKICIKRSTDAGSSWINENNCIDIKPAGMKSENQFLIKDQENNGLRINSEPCLAVMKNSDLLISYSAAFNESDVSDIYFAKLETNTEIINKPVRVNTDKTFNDQYLPNITSDESGNIFISYQDSRNDPENIITETYVSVSTDGGKTFKDEKISTSGFKPSLLSIGNYFGDYNSCVISGNSFISVWTDGRNKNFDIYAGMFEIKDIIGNKNH